VQVIVYAGAIMVLVVFVIMLLNVEHEERRPTRLKFLVPLAVVLAAVLIAEVAFVLVTVRDFGTPVSNVGLTHSIGSSLFTIYLLPFEITSILLLMAMVGAMTLAQRGGLLSANARVVPGSQQLPLSIVDPWKLIRLTKQRGCSESTVYEINRKEIEMEPQLSWYLALSAVLFTIGVTGVIIKRNIIAMFMCIELMLNAVNLTFVAFASFFQDVTGQLFVFIVMTVAAAEAAVGLGIIIAIFRNRETLDVDDASILKL
jgi:NADH-quinone oxidoreductase subunit K